MRRQSSREQAARYEYVLSSAMPIATASPWPQPMAGQLLELVRRPVAEVQRPRRAQLERIAAGRDVRQVQCRGAPDHAAPWRRGRAPQRRGVLLECSRRTPRSLMSAALTASETPPRQSRSEQRRRESSKSLITANGGANVPR